MLTFENPATHQKESLFHDAKVTDSMFRIVVKSNLTRTLAEDLVQVFKDTLVLLDELMGGYKSLKAAKSKETHGGHGHQVC
jgi:hypothetical protein